MQKGWPHSHIDAVDVGGRSCRAKSSQLTGLPPPATRMYSPGTSPLTREGRGLSKVGMALSFYCLICSSSLIAYSCERIIHFGDCTAISNRSHGVLGRALRFLAQPSSRCQAQSSPTFFLPPASRRSFFVRWHTSSQLLNLLRSERALPPRPLS